MSDIFSRRLAQRTLLYVIPMSYFCWLVLSKGTPALRHDWLWPLDKAGLVQHFIDLTTGWFSEGLGHPNAYPMTYPVLWGLMPVAMVFGTRAALVTLVLLVAFAAVATAERIAARFELRYSATAALALFLLFNPWMYNKIVAGHLTQTLAYLGIALVTIELLEPRPHFIRLAFALICTTLQLQFFFVAIIFALTRIRDRATQRAVLTSLVVFSPTLIGIISDREWLLALPFTLPWEAQQSVRLLSGAELGGYFLGYADPAFAGPGALAVLAFAAVAASAPLVVRRRSIVGLAVFAVLTLIFVSGTTWCLAGFWRWAIARGPAIGVFRELYDLIAVVAVIYAVLMGAVLGRFGWLGLPVLAGAIIMAGGWLRHPPADYWVASESLPPPGRALSRAARFAIMPPFQPLSYGGDGSGADPLYAGRAPASAPVNALLPRFPEDVALEKYWQSGDASMLSRLGVSLIECRDGLNAASGFFSADASVASLVHPCVKSEIELPRAAPLVAFQRGWNECSLCATAGAGGIFFGDSAPGRFAALPPEREAVLPARGWVDARLIFFREPLLAQAVGGSFTTQSARALRLPPGPFALVNVSGWLADAGGHAIAHDTHGYRWARLPTSSGPVVCHGACLVAGVGRPGNIPLEAAPLPAQALPIRTLTPWFLSVDVPSNRPGLLRSLTSYDAGWAAFRSDGAVLRHIRVDAAFNGWILGDIGPTHIWLLHVPSLLQAFFALVGSAFVLAVVLLDIRQIYRSAVRPKQRLTPGTLRSMIGTLP